MVLNRIRTYIFVYHWIFRPGLSSTLLLGVLKLSPYLPTFTLTDHEKKKKNSKNLY